MKLDKGSSRNQNSHLEIVQCNSFYFTVMSAQNIFILLPPTALPPFSGRWDGWSFDSGQYFIVWALSPLALHRGQV